MEQTPKPSEPAKPKSNKTMYGIIGAVVIIIIVVLAVYLSGWLTPPPSTPGTPATIYGNGTYSNCPPACGFDPRNLTITHGTKVTWTNNATSSHTVTECISSSDSNYCPNKDATPLSPTFDSGASGITAGSSYSYPFATAGTYYYYCQFHSAMRGEVIVNP